MIGAHGPLVRDSGLSPDFLGQMTSLMGSSTAHYYGPRKPPSGARGRDRQARASLGLAALPLSIFCFFTGGYLVSPGTIGTRSPSTGRVVLTDAFFALDDRSARAISTRFRPLTRLFGANDQPHGVEPGPIVAAAEAPIWRTGDEIDGARPPRICRTPRFRFFFSFMEVARIAWYDWPRSRSTCPVILPTLSFTRADRRRRSKSTEFGDAQLK
jgi:hypothetical protein